MRTVLRITLVCLAIYSIFFLMSGLPALAAGDTNPPSPAPSSLKPDCNAASGDLSQGGGSTSGCGLDDFEQLLRNIINYLTFFAVIPLAVGVIMYGGLAIMTSGGSEERIKKAKGNIQNALWGIAIALGSWLIINAIFTALTGVGVEDKLKAIQNTGTTK